MTGAVVGLAALMLACWFWNRSLAVAILVGILGLGATMWHPAAEGAKRPKGVYQRSQKHIQPETANAGIALLAGDALYKHAQSDLAAIGRGMLNAESRLNCNA